MNYLAHLHLAYVTKTSLEGALMGDFIKGTKLDAHSIEQQVAIRLHRKIDLFTEESSVIQEAKRLFRAENRRFAGIALDVFWDHCLVLKLVENDELFGFLDVVYKDLETEELTPVATFEKLRTAILQYRWFESFVDFSAVEKTLLRITQRRPKMLQLSQCARDLEENCDELQKVFSSFYPQLCRASIEWAEELRT